ncbi:hypothetical protein [Paenibacillus taiwanensis]|uniref:hypothetical protein n=1 Tax=Paenibacillus taiwanensis TaxID=401638 RepID=UPI00040DD0E7|nr:hypothetical protein [Paenibacillus taiwanensis]
MIKQLSAEEFDRTIQDINGAIELNFNGCKYGMFFDDCPFGEERLLRWFIDLLNIAEKIKTHHYIAYRIPDSSNLWLEFISQEIELSVSLVEDMDRDSILDLYIYQPHKEFKYSHWKESKIRKTSFIDEVILNSQKLLNFISVLNPQLLECGTIQMINAKMNNFKE